LAEIFSNSCISSSVSYWIKVIFTQKQDWVMRYAFCYSVTWMIKDDAIRYGRRERVIRNKVLMSNSRNWHVWNAIICSKIEQSYQNPLHLRRLPVLRRANFLSYSLHFSDFIASFLFFARVLIDTASLILGPRNFILRWSERCLWREMRSCWKLANWVMEH
jgi:hypothetical protein